MSKNNWTRNELIVAFNLYCKMGFTKVKYSKPEIVELANLIGRTPSAVAFILVNYGSLDPEVQSRGVKGMSHRSKACETIWNEFHNDWNSLAYESELLLAQYKNLAIEVITEIKTNDLPKEGKERESMIKVRVNQSFFRSTILASYQNTCCITGLQMPELLVASHIMPWAANLKEAANPENGLCLNPLHDKAFDRGLLTITEDYKINMSEKILKRKGESVIDNYFIPYHQKEIIKPNRFLPSDIFLEYHRNKIFTRD